MIRAERGNDVTRSYKWNSSFTIDGFCKFIDSFNQDACDRVDQAMEWMDLEMEDEHFRKFHTRQ